MEWMPGLRRLPWGLLMIWAALCAAGLLGLQRCVELELAGRSLLVRQAVWCLLGGSALAAMAVIDYRVLTGWVGLLFAGAMVLLTAVYFLPPINGAHRWIRAGGVGFQPSELAKFCYVLMLARYLMHRENFRSLPGLLAPLGLTLLPVLLILREPDLGTASLFLPLLLLLLFVAGARRRDLGIVLGAGVLLLPLVWSQMSREQQSRVTALFRQTAAGEKPTADGYHLHQAKQMLVLGGWGGSAVGGRVSEDPTVYHVPEGASDSIFAVLGERYGIAGIGLLLVLYLLLLWQGIQIAEQTREPLGRLAASGIVFLFAIEAVVNAGMMVGLAPITGLSLPLVSYGGSGVLVHSAGIGLLLSIALHPGFEIGPEPFRFER